MTVYVLKCNIYKLLSHVSTHTGKPEPLEAFSTWINRKLLNLPRGFFIFLLVPVGFLVLKQFSNWSNLHPGWGNFGPILFPEVIHCLRPTNPGESSLKGAWKWTRGPLGKWIWFPSVMLTFKFGKKGSSSIKVVYHPHPHRNGPPAPDTWHAPLPGFWLAHGLSSMQLTPAVTPDSWSWMGSTWAPLPFQYVDLRLASAVWSFAFPLVRYKH